MTFLEFVDCIHIAGAVTALGATLARGRYGTKRRYLMPHILNITWSMYYICLFLSGGYCSTGLISRDYSKLFYSVAYLIGAYFWRLIVNSLRRQMR
jgi:bacteriorhodopsin